MDDHVNFVVHAVLFAYQLKQELDGMTSLSVVFNDIEYALPSFSDFFLSRANIGRLNAAPRKARRLAITDLNITMEDLIGRWGSRMFG